MPSFLIAGEQGALSTTVLVRIPFMGLQERPSGAQVCLLSAETVHWGWGDNLGKHEGLRDHIKIWV